MYYFRFSLQRIFISCLVAVLSYNAGTSAFEITSRIAGGLKTPISQAQYMIQLRRLDGSFVCGSTLVSPLYVVTAAHCMLDEDHDVLVAVGGAGGLQDKGVARKVIRVTIHPEYVLSSGHTDIAILKLIAPMQGTNIKTVPLCNKILKTGDMVKVSGWGPTVKGGPLSNQLRSVSIPVRSKDDCEAEYHRFVKKNMFCASGYESKGVCQGDSGGPALYDGQLCGINAFSWYCGMAGSSGGFTDVYALRSYIQNEMKY